MSSKSSRRSKVENQHNENKESPETIEFGSIKPGDQILFEIDSNPGDITRMLWGYVLEKKSKDRVVYVSVDEPFILNKRAGIKDGDVVRVEKEKILGVIEGFDFDSKPVVQIVMQEGVVIDIKRVDGKTSPIMVIVDEGEMATTYQVDHRSYIAVDTE